MKDSDSVELKLTVPESAQRSTVMALGLDPLDAQIRLIYFFDTPDLALERERRRGARPARPGQGDDSVVKLRPVVPSELPDDVRDSRLLQVEVDAMPGGFVCSARQGRAEDARARGGRGRAPIRKLFSKQQRAFYAAHAPDGHRARRPVAAGPDLHPQAQGHAGRLRAQDGRRAVALPRRLAHPRAVHEVRAGGGVPGRRRGARLPGRARHQADGDQTTKTRKALEYFSRRLRRPDPRGQMSRSSRPRATASRREDTPSLR